MKKVNYSDYEGKYDETIKAKMEISPESVDIETMRENLYGYTFTERYAEGWIPDELSMDYWREQHLEKNQSGRDVDVVQSIICDWELAKQDGTIGIYWPVSPQEKLLLKAIDSTGDGKSSETALSVIDIHQEYEYIDRMVRFEGLQLVRQSVNDGIDCLEFKNEEGNIEKLYFDISRRFEVGYPHIS